MKNDGLKRYINELDLLPATSVDFAELSRWFTHKYSLKQWGGPDLHMPDGGHTLEAQINVGSYVSLSASQDGQLLAFGQVQLVKHRAHLARLAVHPEHRGKGYSLPLLRGLISHAGRHIELKSVSLYVYKSNQVARHIYHKFGFTESAVPPSTQLAPDCLYMTMRY